MMKATFTPFTLISINRARTSEHIVARDNVLANLNLLALGSQMEAPISNQSYWSSEHYKRPGMSACNGEVWINQNALKQVGRMAHICSVEKKIIAT